jgi:hypothetical protein
LLLKKIFLLFAFSVALFATSCDIINPEEPIPAYIQIDSFSLVQNNDAPAGSLSQNITDAWVFVDDQMIGIFEIPVRIPIIASGVHKLTIGPGIIVSTISTERVNYPYYTAYIDENFDFIVGETTTVKPRVNYRIDEEYEYIVVDDFENAFTNLDTFSTSDAPILITQSPELVFEGRGSGLIEISESFSKVYFKTPNTELPSAGSDVYLEMDYYSDFEMIVGLGINNSVAQDQFLDYITLKETTSSEKKWKKLYLSMDGLISQATSPKDYFIYFDLAIHEESQQKNGRVLIDNVKFLYTK